MPLDLDLDAGVGLEKLLELGQRALRFLVRAQIGLVVLEVDHTLVVELAFTERDGLLRLSRRRGLLGRHGCTGLALRIARRLHVAAGARRKLTSAQRQRT